MLIKNFIVLILLCLAVVFGAHHIQPLIMALVSAHDWVSQLLLQVFTGGKAGSAIRQLIALIALPLIIGLIPTLVFWMAKKRLFPYFMHTLWAVWLIQTTAIIMLNRVPGL